MKEGRNKNGQNSNKSACSSSKEKSVKNLDDSECILIEKSQEIIVIDDDDDETSRLQKSNKTIESIEDGEIIDTDIETTPKQTHIITQKSNSPQSTKSSNTQKCLFYEDLTSGCDAKDIPLYETIKSVEDSNWAINSTLKDDVILVENSPAKIESKNKIIQNMDDSVVFIGEQIDLEKFHPNKVSAIIGSNFIPLSENNNRLILPTKRKDNDSMLDKVIQPFKKFKDHLGSLYLTSTPKSKRSDDLFTLSEQKKIDQYNTNTYNPYKEVKKTGKRMVIVDGSNVAFGHSLNKEFSVKGLDICLSYFEKMGHEVKAVVPQFRLQKTKSSDPEKLEKLHREGKIVFTPCKNLPGKSTTSYDDRFILQLASEFDAAIVSNDNYRDLLHENPAFQKIIENRVIGYTWCNDMFILPKDPYGRIGPSLSVILNR